jgi:hypothetical protein
LEMPFATGGSGSIFIAGLLDANFRKDMPMEEATGLAKKACAHAMCRDGSSGGCVRTVVISEAGVRDFTPGNEVLFLDQRLSMKMSVRSHPSRNKKAWTYSLSLDVSNLEFLLDKPYRIELS